jgi:hypothetical protein
VEGPDFIFVVLGAYFAFHLIRVGRDIYKDRKSISREYRDFGRGMRNTGRDLATLWALYKRGRKSGLGVSDAIAAASDEMASGKPIARPEPAPRVKNPGGFLGVISAVFVNSVSIIGVYRLHWTVGTGLALYWSENVLTGVIVIATIALWRFVQPRTEDRGITTPPWEVAVITLVFNAAHFAFLLAFLGVMMPRIAPAERFDRDSFSRGLAFVAIFLLFEFIVATVRMSRTSAAQIQQTATSYIQRVTVLHLTIIIGMFALLLFGQARAFFAVFAGLKMMVDVTRRL